MRSYPASIRIAKAHNRTEKGVIVAGFRRSGDIPMGHPADGSMRGLLVSKTAHVVVPTAVKTCLALPAGAVVIRCSLH